MEHTVVNIFGAMIEYFAIYAFLWIFFDINPNRKVLRWICHISMAPMFFLFATYISPAIRPVFFIVCCMIVALCFAGSIYHRMFSIVVFQGILICLEIVLASVARPFMDITAYSHYLALNIINKTFVIVVIAVLFVLSRRYKDIFIFEHKAYSGLLLFFSLTTLLLVFTIEFIMVLLGEPKLYLVQCVVVLMTLFANVALYYLFYQLSVGEKAKSKLKLIDLHLSSQKEQHQYLEHTYREVRKLSHDMKHYLAVIYSLLQQGKTDEAMRELEKRQVEIAQNHVLDTGYPILNSVLTYKIQQAKEKNIQTQVFWNLADPLQIHQTDLALILANGLDNAIEAAEQITDDHAHISITAENKMHYVVIRISNNTANIPQIVEGKIATTKQDKHLHGFGLESIQYLALQYDGDSSVTYHDDTFILTVMLKNIAVTKYD